MSGTAVSRAPQPERGAPVPEHSLHAVPAAGPFRGLARTAVRARLRGLRHGQLTLVEGRHAETFGMAQPGVAPIPVQVLDPGLYRALLLRGTLGAAEAFMDGAWTCADVPALIRLLFQDRAVLEGLDRSWSRWLKPLLRFGYWLQRNHRAGARRNIAAHYDLGNEFFALFLDPTLMYSCAFFEHADTPLEQASVAKLERV